ncbi:Inactive tyrosine-protein kinase 7 [Schistosoma japonicum]|nr:Inactive tyrosine-protein kinase 7 [Schistosoma japonicum]
MFIANSNFELSLCYLSVFLINILHLINNSGASSDSFYFTVSPNDQDVEEGQPLRLRCAVTPSKDIYYSWLHNGTLLQLENESGRRYLEADSNLQILHADRELDPGTYQCQALNRSSTFTTASREAKVNIYWMDPDVHVSLLKPLRYEDIRLGEEVELTCNTKTNPPLSPVNIKWFHNGNARLPNTEFRSNGNLRIAVFGIEHTGSYHCRVIHAAGKLDSRPPFLIQMTNDNPPKLMTDLVNHEFSKFVMRGRSVELVCPQSSLQKSIADGITPITVWGLMPRLGEQQQPVSTLRDIQLVDQDSKLIINNFDVHHVSFYTCEISWPGSPDKYIFLFQVEIAALYHPKRSDFSPRLKKNQPYVVRINEDANLRYYSDESPSNSFITDQISNPTPKITWHKKDEHQPIPIWPPPSSSSMLDDTKLNGPRPRIYALRGRHLVIHSVNEFDSGSYEMILTNTAGRASIVFDILVNFPPEFYQPLTHEEHALDEDSSITLDCGIKKRSLPGSIVYWEKDQRVLEKYANSLMVLENNGETLRFPALKPEDQGQYQCFVQTDGYKERWAGREQTLIVKAKLQFLRGFREHFLEINAQGRIPCKARGYGTVTVEWFRKGGAHSNDLQRIRPPNQVEGGTLIIQYVQKHDAGDYICIAKSTYKNAQINMTVNVIVGEKPQISQISANQTVRVGNQVILNCHASGDPHPQISWIVKKPGYKVPNVYTPLVDSSSELINDQSMDPSDTSRSADHLQEQSFLQQPNPSSSSVSIDHGLNGASSADAVVAAISRNMQANGGRITAFSNGSLIIRQVHLSDQAEYICVAGNKHAIKTRQGVFVRVLTPGEYTRQQLGEDGTNSGMMRTIFIVVGCAVAYLGLIIGLTTFCSIRMVRTRRNRSRKNGGKLHENGQLLSPLNDPSNPNGGKRESQGSGGGGAGNMECGLLLGGGTSGINTTANASLSHLPHYGRPVLTSASGTRSGTSYPDSGTLPYPLMRTEPGLNQRPNISVNDTKCWWPVSENSYYGQNDAQTKLLQSAGAGPIDGFANPLTDIGDLNGHSYVHGHSLMGPSCNLMFSGHKGTSTGVGSSTIATTTSESHLVSAPPPTPLDSRSHFSGVSSGNSTSLYSRSLLSGASNFGSPPNQMTSHTNDINQYDQSNELHTISQTDRMNYPRCELQMEGILGKGEFGDVFLARARHIQEGEAQSLVLVKSLASCDSVHINEFHRQLELFGQSDHDYVTRLLGVCMEQEPFYLLLEYCEWGDLKQFLRCLREENSVTFKMPPLTCTQKMSICKQLALGMDYLAHMHCVHRDLAARNVLLTQNLEVKISSLGLARDVYANEYYRLPNTEQFIPLRWFAPELIHEITTNTTVNATTARHVSLCNGHENESLKQLANPAIPYSTQSDVWAFGILVCEVFSLAALPLARLSDQEIIVAGQRTAMLLNNTSNSGFTKSKLNTIDTSPLKPDLVADIPNELSNLLNRCWSPAPQHRPTFSEIAIIIRDLAAS